MGANIEVKESSVFRQWLICIFVNLPIVTYGIQTGWSSPSIPILTSDHSPSGYPLSSIEISTIASMQSFAAAISCNIFSDIGDRFGRRIGVCLCIVCQVISFIIKLISAHPAALIVSQMMCGVASAGVFCIVPIYIKELCDDSIRGTLSSVGMVLQSCGLLLMFAIGSYLDYYTVLWCVLGLPILNVLIMLKVPESPPYLVKKGRIEEAAKTIAYLKTLEVNHKEVDNAILALKKEASQFENLPKITMKDIFENKPSRRAVGLGFFAITVLDSGGSFAVVAYASVIVRQAGVTVAPELQTLSLPAFTLIGSLLASTLIERLGRKPIMLTSLLLTGGSMGVLATLLLVQEIYLTSFPWVAVFCIIMCLLAYGLTLCATYTVMSEVFNVQVRAKVMGYLIMLGWFMCFLQTCGFAPISEYLGMYTMFYIFSTINLLGVVVCILIMPETKGKSWEEIEIALCDKY